MSVQTVNPRNLKRPTLAIAAGVIAVAVLGYFAQRRPAVVKVATTQTTMSVPEGEAGKAGDLAITEEAMQLAEIKTAPIETRQVNEKLAVTGNVQTGGDQYAKVTARAGGKVVKLLAGAGDAVVAGQTLAVVESTELAQSQAAYRQASARLQAARANLARQKELAALGQFGRPQVEDSRTKAVEAERDVHEAEHHLSEERTKLAESGSDVQALKSQVVQAQTEADVEKERLDRAEALYKEELVSKQELERARADYKKAQADVDVANAKTAQGEARIAGAKARVEAAQGELGLAKKRFAIASGSLTREEKVFKGKYLTSRELVEAEASVRAAQVDVQGAAEAVRLLGAKPGGANTIALIAPISGKVQERSATMGETIDTEDVAFTVVNLNQVWAQLAVSPKDLSRVRIGDGVELKSDTSSNKVFRGRIASIGTAADESTRAVYVRTTLENPDSALKAGSFVRGSLITDVRDQRVAVPDKALQEHTGRPTLYVAKAGKPGEFEVRHVKLGARGDGWREISEGVKPGEVVAVSGTFYLKSEALKSSLSDGCCAPGK